MKLSPLRSIDPALFMAAELAYSFSMSGEMRPMRNRACSSRHSRLCYTFPLLAIAGTLAVGSVGGGVSQLWGEAREVKIARM